MFRKQIKFTDINTVNLEIELQTIASKYGFAPRVLGSKIVGNYCEVDMEKIDAMCLADMYGDNPADLPLHLWSEIHNIVNVLYEEEGIEYIDITPYNFIETDGKIFIIDFGDAYYKGDKPRNWFHKEFLEVPYGWNPDFA